ncbi:MAG: hypothetical protein AAF639_08070 [Chloroflexota bacterium]
MWTIDPPIKLIRYLFALRVNSSYARVSPCTALEFSYVLANMIADRLPTQEAAHWRRALRSLRSYEPEILGHDLSSVGVPDGSNLRSDFFNNLNAPTIRWPINVILHVYPGKFVYGHDELILWEAKFLGDDASHQLFLETLLPAVEEAGYGPLPEFRRKGRLWGNYDIDGVYVANGLQWQPIVRRGEINLRVRPTSRQWANDLSFTLNSRKRQQINKLTWITPFDFRNLSQHSSSNTRRRQSNAQGNQRNQQQKHSTVPSLHALLYAFNHRFGGHMPIWVPESYLPSAEQSNARQKSNQRRQRNRNHKDYPLTYNSLANAAKSFDMRSHEIKPPPKSMPGQGIGTQTFAQFPPFMIPYLVLGSVVHLGNHTHLGCGTFYLGE